MKWKFTLDYRNKSFIGIKRVEPTPSKKEIKEEVIASTNEVEEELTTKKEVLEVLEQYAKFDKLEPWKKEEKDLIHGTIAASKNRKTVTSSI